MLRLFAEGAGRNVPEHRGMDVLRHPVLSNITPPEHDDRPSRTMIGRAVLSAAERRRAIGTGSPTARPPGRHAAGLRIIVSGDRRTAVGMGGGAPGRGYHGHLSAQVVRQSRQALVPAPRSAILDRHAPALDVTRFAQALTERGRKVREGCR